MDIDPSDFALAMSPPRDLEDDPGIIQLDTNMIAGDDAVQVGAPPDAGNNNNTSEVDPEMLALRALRADIKTLCAPHAHVVDKKPPFSLTELTVMALVMRNGESAQIDVRFWILTKFKYYSRLAASKSLLGSMAWGRGNTSAASPKYRRWAKEWTSFDYAMESDSVASPFRSFDAPVYTTSQNHEATLHTTFFTVLSEARIYLGLAGPPKTTDDAAGFRFLDLPAELRVRIYEMCLLFPMCSRKRYGGHATGTYLKVADREGEEEANKLRAQTDKERTIALAEAEQSAQKLRGEGDATATRIYAEAYNKDADIQDKEIVEALRDDMEILLIFVR